MRCIKKLNRALRRIPGPNASFTITVIPPPWRARPAPHALASLRVCVCGALALCDPPPGPRLVPAHSAAPRQLPAIPHLSPGTPQSPVGTRRRESRSPHSPHHPRSGSWAGCLGSPIPSRILADILSCAETSAPRPP